MELSAEQKKALEEQKKQCPFCKIVAGEIPAKKVYEDDKILVILDINPLSKGHVLVMPKEHYPIMPLIPPETFVHLFKHVKDLIETLKKSLLMTGATVFIANGAAAGQMSQHFLFHIIPREENDNISNFLMDGKAELPGDLEASITQNLNIMMQNHFKRNPCDWHNEQQAELGLDKVLEIIEQNPQLKDAILKSPEAVKAQLPNAPQLQQLFSKVSVDEVAKALGVRSSDAFNGSQDSVNPVVDTSVNNDENQVENKPDENTSENLDSSNSSDNKLDVNSDIFLIIEDNPKLKSLILDNPFEFKKKVSEVPAIADLFKGWDLDEIIKIVRENHDSNVSEDNSSNSDDDKEDADLDGLAAILK